MPSGNTVSKVSSVLFHMQCIFSTKERKSNRKKARQDTQIQATENTVQKKETPKDFGPDWDELV